ncbi:MAG: ATP-binding protein, partial [Candidatus Sericytochromatia bacterium]
ANRFTQGCTGFMYGATAGNAFYLTEFLRHLMESNLLVKREGAWELQGCDAHTPPANVEETITRRLANLSPGARDLARIASVIGRNQDREMLLATSGLDPETLFVRLDELLERQFIVREEGRYAFPHDRVRETLYMAMPEADRHAVHQRCGEYLERVHGQSDAHVQDLAHHFRHGQDGRKAFTYLKRAGDAAFDTGAHGVAVERYMEAEAFLAALDDSEREAASIDLWWDIAGLGFNILPGAAVTAADKLTRALAGPAGAGVAEHTVELIKAYALQATAYGFTGNSTKGLEAADKAMALMPPGQTPLHGSLIMIKVANLFPAGHLDEVTALSAKARPYLVDVDLSGQTGLIFNTRVGAISYPNTCALMGVRPDTERREHALWAVEDGKAYSLINIINAFFGIWAAWTGRQPDAVTYIEESNQSSRKLGAPPYPWPLYLRPYLLWQRGEYADALQLAERALAFPHLDHIDLAKQLIVILKGQAHLALGELDEAEKAFTAAEARGREAPMAIVLMRALLAKGELALVRRDFAGARQALTEAVSLAQGGPTRNPLHEALAERQLAELAINERQFARARAHMDAAMAIVTRPEQDNMIEQAHLHRLRGEAYLEQNDAIAAGDSLRKAGDLYHRLKNRHGLHLINKHLATLHQAPEAPQATEATPEQRFEHLRGMLMR